LLGFEFASNSKFKGTPKMGIEIQIGSAPQSNTRNAGRIIRIAEMSSKIASQFLGIADWRVACLHQ